MRRGAAAACLLRPLQPQRRRGKGGKQRRQRLGVLGLGRWREGGDRRQDRPVDRRQRAPARRREHQHQKQKGDKTQDLRHHRETPRESNAATQRHFRTFRKGSLVPITEP
ncbi:hypothetical protein DDE23_15565 [Pararhodobacter aggregans]|uniref:Uncharacterized protein n=1 Tax=Pararhodobacter aggregans TaxID=404875 RepID=A0A2T7UPI8_9RHOB|nr:hypothetical protein DDE23_15565 [Pararhodobacter aggregans]